MKRIIIVGAGASGMMAAISAAEAAGPSVKIQVLEHLDKVGKKILATGNGHCNYTNSHMDAACYHDDQTAFSIIRQFDHEKTVAYMKKIGIFPSEKNGYFYPLSNQASSVTFLLRKRMEELGIEIETDIDVRDIVADHGRYLLQAEKTLRLDVKEKQKKNGKKKVQAGEIRKESRSYQADALILACGGMAGQGLGSDGSGYRLAKSLGHKIKKPLPALTGITCEEEWFKECAGVRIQAEVTIFVDGRKVAADRGELQLTDYGISGIPVFQVSRYAARALEEGRKVEASLLFYPEISDAEKNAFLANRREEDLAGFYPDKLLKAMKAAGLTDYSSPLHCRLKSMTGFERAQVTCGGVFLSEVDETSLESKYCRNLYFCGELLDVDAICGGYNLQWAWSSGYLAGRSAALSLTNP